MNIDKQLYSRQIAAFEIIIINKLSKLNVLIYGLRGLGIEICKNIILAGPQKVTIFDNNKICIEDLCSNFYIEEKYIGYRRDEICLKKLKELNNYIKYEILNNENFDENIIKNFDIVIIIQIM